MLCHPSKQPAPINFVDQARREENIMSFPRRFPPPWSVEEQSACFVVRDANGQQLSYVYFEEEPGRRSAAKLLTQRGVSLNLVFAWSAFSANRLSGREPGIRPLRVIRLRPSPLFRRPQDK
jgi:hypothetical protein